MIGLYFGALAILYLFLRLWHLNRSKPSGKWFMAGASVVLTLILFEIGANVVFFINSGNWVFAEAKSQNSQLWEAHPDLVGVNKKGVRAYVGNHFYSHNSQGFRGKELDENHHKIRIVAIGASTTYGVGVNDNETWPHYLDSLLGGEYEVVNMGVPGYSTVEHIKQVELQLKDLKPDIVLLHVGLNDLRVSHVDSLKSDYSNFHKAGLYSSFGLCYLDRLPKLASIRAMVVILQKIDLYPICFYHRNPPASGRISAGIDSIALGYYLHNLEQLINSCKEICPEVYTVPQVINKERFIKYDYSWWIPYIEPEAIDTFYKAYNKQTRKTTEMLAANYISEIDSVNWEVDDFCDAVHLGALGNLKLAKVLKGNITSSQDL